MKKFTALLGILGAVGMYTACSNDTVSAPIDDNSQAEINSSDTVSGDGDDSPSSSSASRPSTKDSVVHVVITSSGSRVVPYSSSGTFCWSEKCASAAPQSSSSSVAATIDITMSSEAPVLPTINGNTMIDNRDGKQYSIETINGLRWMADNLNYETASGSFCSAPGSSDMCSKYGRFYTSPAAKKACPTNWRLPTSEEIAAVDKAVPEEWWTLGGRMKYSGDEATDYGLDEQQGYWWIASGASWRVQPDTDEHVEQSSTGGEGRAYSVRCVSDQ